MGANIEQNIDLVGGLARDKHRVQPHLANHKIPDVGNFTVMGQRKPSPAEQPFHLQFVYFRIGEHPHPHRALLEIKVIR